VVPFSGVRYATITPSATRYAADPPSASNVPKYWSSFVNDTSTKASGAGSRYVFAVASERFQISIV
jgi:hypothetical protein